MAARKNPGTRAGAHEGRQRDNLFVIAPEYGVTAQQLFRLDGITPQAIIRPAQMLLVAPGG